MTVEARGGRVEGDYTYHRGTDILICAMYVHPSALLALEPWRDGPGRVGFSLKAYVSSLVVGTLWAGYECIAAPTKVISEAVTVCGWLRLRS